MKEDKFSIDITTGIESTIWKSIEESIHLKNIESFDTLNDFISNILFISIREDSLSNFTKYINFPASYIKTSDKFLKSNISYNEIHTFCIKRVLELYHYILDIKLTYPIFLNSPDVDKIDINNLKRINEFIYLTINSFNRQLYNCIQIKSLQVFKKCYTSFTKINNLDNTHILQHFKIAYYTHKDLETDDENQKILNNIYSEVNKFSDYLLHVKIGLKYWSIFLFSKNIIDLTFTKEIFDTIHFHLSIAELIKKIIDLRDLQFSGYLEWTNWDYIERESGVSYYPPDPRNWLVFGLLIDLIRKGVTELQFQQYSYQDKRKLQDLYNSFVDKIHVFRNNFDHWKELIKCKSIEELEERAELIISFFENINQDVNIERINAISEAVLDETKVDNFKETLEAKIKKDSLFINVIKSFVEQEDVEQEDVEQKLLYMANLKGVFINGEHSFNLPGTESILGQQFSEIFDDEILSFLNERREEVSYFGDNLSEAITNCITDLVQLDRKVTSAIISSEDFYNISERLYSNENFIPNNDPALKFFIGEFKNINIYLTNSKQAVGQVLLWDQDTISLNLRTLEVNVVELTDAEINTEYQFNKHKWNRNTDGTPLDEKTSKALIKNGVNISLIIDYEIVITEQSTIILTEIKRHTPD
ncbi:hypothetical protein GJV76_13920 [Myroides sp. BIT-d1]|uniref:Uncharacterized protein n=1 Tax=Myroides albus TaxID=2562892 RepID=A0A6I3LPF4_9FLAO|nr:hypothetical protein [Myroides albus]MTG99210.1 hypothetical protein [Myroides albus]